MFGSRYREIKKLGQGGMGAVYLVHDQVLGRNVALKVISATDIDQALIDSFRAEFRSLTVLRHPNILAVYDFGLTLEGAPYFTMEAIDGRELEADPATSVAWLCEVAAQICRALAFVHDHNLVHYDLKPPNIMVTREALPQARLMDFGLAGGASQQQGAIKGTIAYVAPEMIRGEPADYRVDLYSLGAMLYELATGQHPFPMADTMATLRAHLNNPPPRASALRPDLPARMDQLIMRLMAKTPDQRPQTAMAVIAELEAISGSPLPLEVEGTLEAYVQSAAFTGRDDVISRLRQALATLATEGAALAIFGEAGLGKSRLLKEFRYEVLLAERRFFTAYCYEGSQEAYLSVRQVLEMLVWEVEGRHSSLLAEHAGILLEVLPHLADRPYMAGKKAFPPLPPDERKERLFKYASQFLIEACRLVCSVIAIEDYHWADAMSVAFWQFMADRVGQTSLVLILTSRTAADVPDIAVFPLQPFADDHLARYVQSVFGRPFDERLVQWILAEGGGNPLYTETLLRHLMGQGIVHRTVTGWGFDAAALQNAAVDNGLVGLMSHQYTGRDGADKRLLSVAAVISQGFEAALLHRILGGDEADLTAQLQRLVDEDVLLKRPWGETYLYDYKIGKLREVVRRCEAAGWPGINREVATALEAHHAGDLEAVCERLTRHWAEAGETLTAARYALRAGRKNAPLYANEAAIGFFRLAQQDPEQRLVALEGLGDVLFVVGAYADAIASYNGALAGLLGHGLRPEPEDYLSWRPMSLEGWQAGWLWLDHPLPGLERAVEAQVLAEAGLWQEASDAWRSALDAWFVAWNPLGIIGTLANMALCAALLGQRAEATSLLQRARGVMPLSGWLDAHATVTAAAIAGRAGDVAGAGDLLQSPSASLADGGLARARQANLATALGCQGLWDQADSAWASLPGDDAWAAAVHRAALRAEAGDWDGVAAWLPEGDAPGHHPQAMLACRLSAQVSLAAGQPEAAAGLAHAMGDLSADHEVRAAIAVALQDEAMLAAAVAGLGAGAAASLWQGEWLRHRGDAPGAMGAYQEGLGHGAAADRTAFALYGGMAWAARGQGLPELADDMERLAIDVRQAACQRLTDRGWQQRVERGWRLPDRQAAGPAASLAWLDGLAAFASQASPAALAAWALAATGGSAVTVVLHDGAVAHLPGDAGLEPVAAGLLDLWRQGDTSQYPGAWPILGPAGVVGALMVADGRMGEAEQQGFGAVLSLCGAWLMAPATGITSLSLPAMMAVFRAGAEGDPVAGLLEQVRAAVGAEAVMAYAFPELTWLGGKGPEGPLVPPDQLPDVLVQAISTNEVVVDFHVPEADDPSQVLTVTSLLAVPMADTIIVCAAPAADRVFEAGDAATLQDLAGLISLMRTAVEVAARP
jgi:tRNA A-37 threonylcarbamoyl transferase component Bud32